MASELNNPAAERRQRAPVGLLALWFGVLAAPLLWVCQLYVNYLITALACFPSQSPYPAPLYGYTVPMMYAFDAIAIVFALAGFAVSYISYRNAAGTPPGRHALDVFDERTRFMAIWGMLFSGGFLIAIVFETIASFTVGLCGV